MCDCKHTVDMVSIPENTVGSYVYDLGRWYHYETVGFEYKCIVWYDYQPFRMITVLGYGYKKILYEDICIPLPVLIYSIINQALTD